MCACRYSVPTGSPPQGQTIDIDNYYMIGENMGDHEDSGGGYGDSVEEEDDVYSQLAQKERDLTLAAELGKALLEKNEELERRNEQVAEEYAHRIEELEQEKYELHMRLEKKEAEYENTIKELQYDIGHLRQELHSQQYQSSTDVRERSDTIRDLTQQNERLQEEVRMASFREEELASQVKSLREKVTNRRSSMHIHISQLEVLQQEINLLNHRKGELERRIAAVTEEKNAMACSLEESQEKILVLEKSKRETELRIQNQERDIMELQETNVQLQSQLQHMSTNFTQPSHRAEKKSQSLFSEISQMSPNSVSPALTPAITPVLTPDSPRPLISESDESGYCHQMSLAEMMEADDDFECDDDDVELPGPCVSHSLHSPVLTDSQFLTHFQSSPIVMETDDSLRQELVEAYTQLKHMCSAIKERRSTDSLLEQMSECESVQMGNLTSILQELRELMQDMMAYRPTIDIESQVSIDNEDIVSVTELQKHISELKNELLGAQGDLDRVKSELSHRDVQLEEKTKELGQLTNKMTMQHDTLAEVQAQRDQLQTTLAGQGQISRDEIVQEARRDRDLAIEKQNKMEIELAKAKLDLLSLNSQLMEAIQQKVVLSQELDQWQVDMEQLLEVQIKKRIKQESDKEEIYEQLKKHIQGIRKSKSTSFLPSKSRLKED
ncbi:hypothetical protein FSP39_004795 [Pinctada imbricata]|uniref:Uncharacterized protein n=1 Tax=Pinctada imbricata TaxID=66713 RepID=A0AA89BQL7_PINIB|nr:hypothetical protein FSP39_004795 [Pinctada imbricata]